ncbi:Pilus assembly protein CpaE [Pseudomonas sp. 8Z]|uniref:AAA family ATPase n=1 Tax=Pseudomonas sp. 8Z TaxID=2653166 RepID=UPI0012EF8544|nr:histidine kinase [Pseudomonas sp. 8Z]VXD00670.1 Pilus assembly protein CpaE [Pseudomonas sp. 8Z]
MNDTTQTLNNDSSNLMLFAATSEEAGRFGEQLQRLGQDASLACAGGIAAAIAWSRNNPPPQVLLVDIDGDAMPLQSLAELGAVCDPACHIVAIGSKQDVDLYRNLLHSGVFDYLAKPVTLDLLAATLGRARAGQATSHGARSGRTIAVSGASGGCGVSTVVAGLAQILSLDRHMASAVVDFDRHNGDQSLLLGYEGDAGLAGALSSGEIDSRLLQRAMGQINERLHLLAQAPTLRPEQNFSAEHLLFLGANLCHMFNQVIWDLPAGRPHGTLDVLAHAQTRILLTDLTVQDARNLHRLLREIGDESDGQHLLVVANAARGNQAGVVERSQFEDFIERRIDLQLPHAGSALAGSLLTGSLNLNGAPALQLALQDLADLATGHTPKRTTVATSNLLSRLKRVLNRQAA